jgi:methylated-DNA-[protein]-cysteine S-methyltransferase
MTSRGRPCVELERDLLAAASGEAGPETVRRVEQHVVGCAPCARAWSAFRTLDEAVARWRATPVPESALAAARARLAARWDDLRRRTLVYRVVPSPLGRILIARSAQGVSLVAYLGRARGPARARGNRLGTVELIEDHGELAPLAAELTEYLQGRRTRLEWPLDLRLAQSAFQRAVLEATAAIPYGAVASYATLACLVGRHEAPRAVAQALRWNPLPIVIPCHRVVGSTGTLTGYAGHRIDLKARLLGVEGIPVRRAREPRVMREAMYVGEPGDRWYCLPTCPSLRELAHPHRVLRFGTRERAEADGRAPCRVCRPDLHPLWR